MLPIKREPTSDDLEVSSTPVDRPDAQVSALADVTVAALSGFAPPAALALASMRRARQGAQEEVWAQFFIDGVFLDVGRATEIDSGAAASDVTFVARFTIPSQHLDGDTHRVRVCFVSSVSRVVPRGDGTSTAGGAMGMSDLAPQGIAEADFAATFAWNLPLPS